LAFEATDFTASLTSGDDTGRVFAERFIISKVP
jgi:hypothetical protein